MKSSTWLRWGRWGFTLLGALGLWLVLGGVTYAQESLEELSRSVNTMWVLLAAFLVFFMQAGFALLESGSTRAKNTVNILMKNVLDFCFATLSYWAIGYAFMFGAGSISGFIGTTGFFLTGMDLYPADDIPVLAFWLFQLVFAGTAATIVSGAVAERTKFRSYIIYSMIITAFIYPIFGHWVWGGGWLNNLSFLGEGVAFSDFAGSTVVHSVGGWAALMGAIVLGPRIGRFDDKGNPQVIPGHSITMTALGTFILWLGWFGFNPGSQLAAGSFGDANAIALVAATTNIAAASGAVGALVLAWLHKGIKGKPDVGFTLNGALGGLVAITAPCAVVSPASAVIIGLVGGAIVVLGTDLLLKLKIDDPVGAVPVHLMSGAWGTLSLGLFAFEGGLFTTGEYQQLLAQIVGVLACAVWTGVTSFALFTLIDKTIGMRVSPEEEHHGLDLTEHDIMAYPDDIHSDDQEAVPTPQPGSAGAGAGAGA